MGNRGLTSLLSFRLSLAVFGLALPRPASGGTGCHKALSSLGGCRVNLPDLGLIFGVWLQEGSTGRAHPSRLLIPKLLVEVGWSSLLTETRSNELNAASVLRDRKEELQRYIRALEYRNHGLPLGA